MEMSMRSNYIVLAVALSVSVASMAWSADEPAPPAAQPAAQPAATPAAQPAAQAAPPAPAAASSTSTEAAAKTPAKETATAADNKNSEADAQEKHLLASGYKKKTRNGETVYCRKEIPLGSRFEKERCGSAQEMELQAQQARDLMNGNKITGGGSK
jgi:hypothetical protein